MSDEIEQLILFFKTISCNHWVLLFCFLISDVQRAVWCFQHSFIWILELTLNLYLIIFIYFIHGDCVDCTLCRRKRKWGERRWIFCGRNRFIWLYLLMMFYLQPQLIEFQLNWALLKSKNQKQIDCCPFLSIKMYLSTLK